MPRGGAPSFCQGTPATPATLTGCFLPPVRFSRAGTPERPHLPPHRCPLRALGGHVAPHFLPLRASTTATAGMAPGYGSFRSVPWAKSGFHVPASAPRFLSRVAVVQLADRPPATTATGGELIHRPPALLLRP